MKRCRDKLHADGRPHPWWSRDGDAAVGVRAPIGLDLNLHDPRLQFFADIAATAAIVPAPVPGIDANVGARYYF